MKKRFDIIGIGHPCADYLIHIESIPGPNESRRALEGSWQAGGKVPTGLAAAARCGLSCAFIGSMGDDLFGQYCYYDFQKHGIDLSAAQIQKGSTTDIGVVLSDKQSGGRNIIYRRGSYRRPALEDIDFSLFASADYLYIALADELHIAAAKYAKEHGLKVLIDADNRPLSSYMGILPYIDYFIASEFVYQDSFADEQYEKHMREIIRQGPSVVAFTFGDKGCRVLSDEGYFEIPAFRVDAIDTTGAGDVFHGAFFYGLKQHYSIRDTAVFASAVSAVKCTCIGGRAGIPTPEVTRKFIRTGEIDSRELQERTEEYSWGINTFFKETTNERPPIR